MDKNFIKEKTLLLSLTIIFSNLSFGLSCWSFGNLIGIILLLLSLFTTSLSLKLILEKKKKSNLLVQFFNLVTFCILSIIIYRGYLSYVNGYLNEYRGGCIGDMGCCPSPYDIREIYSAIFVFFIYFTNIFYKKIKKCNVASNNKIYIHYIIYYFCFDFSLLFFSFNKFVVLRRF